MTNAARGSDNYSRWSELYGAGDDRNAASVPAGSNRLYVLGSHSHRIDSAVTVAESVGGEELFLLTTFEEGGQTLVGIDMPAAREAIGAIATGEDSGGESATYIEVVTHPYPYGADNYVGIWADRITFNKANPNAGKNWGLVPTVGDDDGGMEIGQYVDFHRTASGTEDYDARLIVHADGTLHMHDSDVSDSPINCASRGVHSQGTTNSWRWVKFSGGLAVCEYEGSSLSRSITNTSGAIYWGSTGSFPNFPFAFINAPQVSISLVSSGDAWCWTGGTTTTNVGTAYFGRGTSQTIDAAVRVTAIGRWK